LINVKISSVVTESMFQISDFLLKSESPNSTMKQFLKLYIDLSEAMQLRCPEELYSAFFKIKSLS